MIELSEPFAGVCAAHKPKFVGQEMQYSQVVRVTVDDGSGQSQSVALCAKCQLEYWIQVGVNLGLPSVEAVVGAIKDGTIGDKLVLLRLEEAD